MNEKKLYEKKLNAIVQKSQEKRMQKRGPWEMTFSKALINYEEYIISFIDLLGWKQLLVT